MISHRRYEKMLKYMRISLLSLILISSAEANVPVVINELMASNNRCIQDPQGQYDDWIEIYNYGSQILDLGGLYLTDDLSVPDKWQIPSATIILAGGYRLIWADDDTADAGLHANFKLDADGEEVALFDSDGIIEIDSITFPAQTTDISYGRYPDANNEWLFFEFPSPEQENEGGVPGVVADTKFSQDHGFYSVPFEVEISTETHGAMIVFTTDGSAPSVDDSLNIVNGTLYTEPITISGTTNLRAAAFKLGYLATNVDTQTYLFTSDIIQQTRESALAAGLPSSWGSRSADYEMDPDIVYDARYRDNIKNALTSIPTMSIVVKQEDMFGTGGVYSNPNANIEKPASVELIYPDGTQEGFQVNCGIKIIGGASRRRSLKNSFRLLFKGIYGPTKLRFPLFGPDAASEYNTIVLRSSFNDGYGWNDARFYEQFTRDEYIRILQRDMGQVSPNNIIVHLYINGLYWGLYFPCERPDASFSASYYGGDEEDWDTFSHPGIDLREGNDSALNQMTALCRQASNSHEAYQKLQGNNPDGSRNPDYPWLLDVTNYIDYLILNFCVNNSDWPWNNYWFGRKRTADSTGFKFHSWDAEISLYLPGDGRDRADMDLDRTQDFRNVGQFNGYLIENDEYRMFFADRVHHFLFNDGVLRPEYMRSLYLDIADKVEMPVICESARWGDMHHHPPLNQDDWYNMRDWLLDNFFQQRHDIVLQQLKNAGLYPEVDAPRFLVNNVHRHGGEISSEDLLGFQNSNASPGGVIYYTLDGTDPRLPATTEPSNQITLVPENASKRVLVPTGTISDNWKGGGTFNHIDWISGTGGIGYERNSGYEPYIGIDLEDRMYGINTTCYIRVPFNFHPGENNISSLTLKIRYDDGFIAYINGVEIARRNFNGMPSWNSSADTIHDDSAAIIFEDIDVSSYIDTINPGENILAIHGLNESSSSSDFLISTELDAYTDDPSSDVDIPTGVIQYTGPITLTESTHVKARVLDGSTWSALNEATYAVGPVAENLRVTEIMYHPQNDPNEEFIELMNIGDDTINLNMVKFTNGIDFIFPSLELASGEYVVVVQDINAFEARYSTGHLTAGTEINIGGEYTGRLANAGERIRLEDAIGQTILDFSYKDGWYDITDGHGLSLTILDKTNSDPNSWGEKESWCPSSYNGGSPGRDDSIQ